MMCVKMNVCGERINVALTAVRLRKSKQNDKLIRWCKRKYLLDQQKQLLE